MNMLLLIHYLLLAPLFVVCYAIFVDHLFYICLVLCFRARLFIDALRSPAGKALVCDV